LGFTWKIYAKAHEYKKLEGDSKRLFEEKEVWIRYSLFYESYKKSYWWIFIPVIVYMFARGCVIAGFNGHGLFQASGQLIVEGLMLILLLWTRPFERKSSQWINITIQSVRVLSVGCVLIFVEELGISQTTKTITGVVLIVVQCCLTGILAILILVNTIIGCIKENPHRRMRKAAEQSKLDRDMENLTPLSPHRSSMMMDEVSKYNTVDPSMYKAPVVTTTAYGAAEKYRAYDTVREHSPASTISTSYTRPSRFERDDEALVSNAAHMGRARSESTSQESYTYDARGHAASRHHNPQMSVASISTRQPKLPEMEFGRAM